MEDRAVISTMLIKRNEYVTRTKILSCVTTLQIEFYVVSLFLNVELEKPRKKEIQNILVFA